MNFIASNINEERLRVKKKEEYIIDYTEHIVAFIDILGFSKLIENASTDNDLAKLTINHLIGAIESNIIGNVDLRIYDGDESDPRINYKIFSDCICISYKLEGLSDEVRNHMIYSFFQKLMFIQAELVRHSIFIRGGITIDKHYQNQSIIFSQALVNSYNM
jgi:hypothetical protein